MSRHSPCRQRSQRALALAIRQSATAASAASGARNRRPRAARGRPSAPARGGPSGRARCPRTARPRPWRSRRSRPGRSARGRPARRAPRPPRRTISSYSRFGLHAQRAPPRASSSPSPWKTRSPTRTAGTRRDAGRARGRGRGRPAARAMPRSSAPLSTAAGCISAAAAAISTVSRSPRSRPGGEGLAERGHRVGDHAAALLGVGRDEHRPRRVGGQLGRPAQRQHAVGGRAALDVGAEDRQLLGAAEAVRRRRSRPGRTPARCRARRRPLRREVRVGRREVVVEDRRVAHGAHSGRRIDMTTSVLEAPVGLAQRVAQQALLDEALAAVERSRAVVERLDVEPQPVRAELLERGGLDLAQQRAPVALPELRHREPAQLHRAVGGLQAQQREADRARRRPRRSGGAARVREEPRVLLRGDGARNGAAPGAASAATT